MFSDHSEQQLNSFFVRLMYDIGFSELVFAALRLVAEQVALECLRALDLARSGKLEPLGGPGVGLHLRHDSFFWERKPNQFSSELEN